MCVCVCVCVWGGGGGVGGSRGYSVVGPKRGVWPDRVKSKTLLS